MMWASRSCRWWLAALALGCGQAKAPGWTSDCAPSRAYRDLDGDGFDDTLLGATGQIWLLTDIAY